MLIEQIKTEVDSCKSVVNNTTDHMLQHLQRAAENAHRAAKQSVRLLAQFDPKLALQRGYALVRTAGGDVVRGSAVGVGPGDTLTVTTQHAIITTGVKNVVIKKS